LKIPAGQKLVYIVLSSEQDEKQQTRWLGNTLGAADWKESSLKLFNASSESLGIIAGKKRIQLPQGKAVDFHAGEWSQSFPVKIVRLQPELKTVFSSTWRVSEGCRELCFIGNANGRGSIKIRSLLELIVPPPSASRCPRLDSLPICNP